MKFEEEMEGVDTGVSEDAFEQDPVLSQFQTEHEQDYWLRELQASRNERKAWDNDAVSALERYRDKRDSFDKDNRYYNVYYANADIKMSALYARTPQPDISPRFKDAEDDASRVACNLLQRSISYELEASNFNSTFRKILFDRLVPGMGVGWVRFEQEEQEQEPVLDPLTGQLMQLPPAVINQEARIDYVAWDDFLWAPCKTWDLCRWVCRRIPMNKQDIKNRFGSTCPAEVLGELAFSQKDHSNERVANLQTQNKTTKTVDVYEIWDKDRKIIFWIAESATVPLDVQADTNEFPGFFPTPQEPLGRFDNCSTQPITDYHLVRDKYIELDSLNNRRSKLSEAMGVRFVYDASNKALKDLYTLAGENEGIGVENMAEFNGKGGIAGSIQFAPLGEVTASHQAASAQLAVIKDEIAEMEGISDIARGIARPYETATSITAQATTSSARLSVQQLEVARYIEKLLKLQAHVISKFYQPEFLLKRAGVLPAPDRQHIPAAIQLLRDQQLSQFRLEVSVDSIQMENWQNEKRERTEAINAVTNAATQLFPIAQQSPSVAPTVMALVKYGLTGFRGSQAVTGYVDQALRQLAQDQANKQGQPPKPSPEEVKAQAQQQKSQTDLQIAQIQEQNKLQLAQMEMQFKAMMAQMEQQRAQDEMRIRQLEASIKAKEIDARIVHDQISGSHKAAMDLMNLRKGD